MADHRVPFSARPVLARRIAIGNRAVGVGSGEDVVDVGGDEVPVLVERRPSPSLLSGPCRSSSVAAISTPLALNQGPRPIRSRALTAALAGAAVVLRYARHSCFHEPAAVASFTQ